MNTAKQAADVELHSMKCSCTDAMYSVQADASVAQDIAAAIKTKYRGSNFTLWVFFAGSVLKGTGGGPGGEHIMGVFNTVVNAEIVIPSFIFEALLILCGTGAGFSRSTARA